MLCVVGHCQTQKSHVLFALTGASCLQLKCFCNYLVSLCYPTHETGLSLLKCVLAMPSLCICCNPTKPISPAPSLTLYPEYRKLQFHGNFSPMKMVTSSTQQCLQKGQGLGDQLTGGNYGVLF